MATVDREDGAAIVEWFGEQHRLGEHVAIVGQTGSGKSTLALALLTERGAYKAKDGRPVRIAILADKRRDTTLQRLGWPRISRERDWPPGYAKEQCVVWPPYGDAEKAPRLQRPVFRHVLREVSDSGNQIVYIDEVAYWASPTGLNMGPLLEHMWTTQRSNSVSLFGSTQRPRKVPVAMWTETEWLFVFNLRDREDVKRVGDFGQKDVLLDVVPQLEKHEFLMMRRSSGDYLVGRL